MAVRLAAAGMFAAIPLAAIAIPANADANVPSANDVSRPWQHGGDWDGDHHDRDHHDGPGWWDHRDGPGRWDRLPFPMPFCTGSFGC